jgi:uncharacterized Tic20 family protein
LATIGVLSIVIVAAVARLYLDPLEKNQNEAVGHLSALLASILPLLGAWVGTIIAFYFARDNFDAATRNTSALLRQVGIHIPHVAPSGRVLSLVATIRW